MSYDLNEVKSETKYKDFRRLNNMWEINHTFLNNQQVKKLTRDTTKYSEMNKNKNTKLNTKTKAKAITPLAKAMLREKRIPINTHFKKGGKNQINT